MKRNRIFFVIYFIFWLADALLVPYLGLYFEECGLSGAQIGALSLTEALVTPVVAIFAGFALASAKKPVPLIIAMPVGCALSAAMMVLFGNYAGILAATVLFYLFRTPFNSAVDRILIARLHDAPASYSLYRSGGSIGYGIGALIAGAVYSAHTSSTLFWWYCPAILVTAAVCFGISGRKGTPPEKTLPRETEKHSLRKVFCFDGMKLDGTTLIIYGSLLLLGLLTSAGGKFMAIYIRQQGLDPSITGTMIAFAMIGEILIAFLFPVLAKKTTSTEKFLFGFILYMIKDVSIAFIASIPLWLVMIMQICGGAAFTLFWAATTTMIEAAYPPQTGFVAQTLKNIFYNCAGYGAGCMLLASFYDHGRLGSGYRFLVVLAVACTFGYAFLAIRQHRKRQVQP